MLEDVTAALNTAPLTQGGSMQAITPADCASMQAKIDALPGDTTCIAKYAMCTPFKYVEGSGDFLQTWVAVVFPIPSWHTGTTFQFNTLLRTNLTG